VTVLSHLEERFTKKDNEQITKRLFPSLVGNLRFSTHDFETPWGPLELRRSAWAYSGWFQMV